MARIAEDGLVRTDIAGMTEEALCVLRRDGIERWPQRLMQGIDGAGGDLAQPSLDLGPGWLDRVEVGRVRWQVAVTELGAVEKPPHGLSPSSAIRAME